MANDDTKMQQDRQIMASIIDSSSARQSCVKALLFEQECLHELMEVGCGNASTQRRMNQINATLLHIETMQLEFPF